MMDAGSERKRVTAHGIFEGRLRMFLRPRTHTSQGQWRLLLDEETIAGTEGTTVVTVTIWDDFFGGYKIFITGSSA